MAKDVADVLGTAIGKVAREAAKSLQQNQKHSNGIADTVSDRMKNVSGSKGLAAGVGLATVVPLVAKGAGKLVRGIGSDGGPIEKTGKKLGEGAKQALPGGGGKSKGMPGVGKGRRMPVQQDIDIGAPIDMVYEHWTKYDEWPQFMHRLDNVSQDDKKHVSFKTKIWGISKEFRAEIVEENPKERIKWEVTDGVTHTGVVTFHELGPRLTRVEVNIDVQPGSMIEKAARGMRHVKRAVRADMARFKAYVLMQEQESSGSSSSSRSSGGRKQSSSSGRKRSTTSARSRSSSSNSRSRSTSARKRSSSGRKSASSSNGSRASSSNGRSSASRTRASSSNGRSRSSAKKRSGARS
jgi:uncharacterized membrane protein